MKERHFAYKIIKGKSDLVCHHHEFEEDKMLDLLQNIQNSEDEGIYWIFKQFNGEPQEALAIIDCAHHRIYYHHSGEVDSLETTIKKLNQSMN